MAKNSGNSKKGGSGAQGVMPKGQTRTNGKPFGQLTTPKTLGGKKS